MAARVAIGWLDTYIADSVFYLWSDGDDVDRATYFDKRRGRAARRLIQAVRCLADVQRVRIEEVNYKLTKFEFVRNN